MLSHHCSSCGAFSQHGGGTWSWAVTCPNCSHTEPQNPHTPDPRVDPPAAPVHHVVEAHGTIATTADAP